MTGSVTTKADFYYADSTARIAAQGNIAGGQTAEDNDTGTRYVRTSSGWTEVTSGSSSLADRAGSAYLGEISNLTTTRQTVSDFSTGVWAITLDYKQLTGTAGTRLFFVRNADDDTDADAKLASASTREAVNISAIGTFSLPTLILADSVADPITRLDIIAETAIGTDTTRVTFTAVGNAP